MTSRPNRHAVRLRATVVLVAVVLAACGQGAPSSFPDPSATAFVPSPARSAATSSSPSAAQLPSSSVSSSGPVPPSTEPVPSRSSAGSPPTAPLEPASAAPIRLVESGFTGFPDSGDFGSFAAILENPNSRWAAMRMRITVDFLDADGGFVAGQELFVQILPGQRTAIAGEVFGAGSARRMTVNLPEDTTAFEAFADAEQSFAVSGIETAREDGLNRTRGRVTSRFGSTQTSIQLTAVYRNAAGRIVGGAVGGVESIAPGATQAFEIIDSAPFRSIADTEVYWQISGVRR